MDFRELPCSSQEKELPGRKMRTDTMIYTAVALCALLPLGTIGALLWSDRRWRERERWLREHCMPSLVNAGMSSAPAEAKPRLIPIRRRAFHEALWEDEPDLAPSPGVRAIARELAARRRRGAESLRAMGEQEPLSRDGLPVASNQGVPQMPPSWREHIAEAAPEREAAFVHEEKDEMKWSQVAATAALAAGMASGCTDGDGSRWHELPRKREFRVNPNPKEKYELTVTIANAPGPLTSIEGGASYLAQNCKHGAKSGSYSWSMPEEYIPIQFVHADGQWKGHFALDAWLDEDYGYYDYARACHWTLGAVGVTLRATGAANETLYIATLVEEPFTIPEPPVGAKSIGDVRAEKPKVLYFTKNTYPTFQTSNGEAWQDSGTLIAPTSVHPLPMTICSPSP